ncbi:Ubiquitin thioesterase otubain-like [Armadillidium vulgare]|nr:Ubiquitin thioesterase otubain-like [Armadillidium vulgare]
MEESEKESLDTVSPENAEGSQNQDELIMAQEKEIAEEIKNSFPLIGPLEGLGSLQKEFEHDVIYSSKLQSKFSRIRRTRPDGNCFLRGFIFAYLDYCVQNREELTRFKKILESSKTELFDLGFPKFTTEDFYDMFVEVVSDLEANGTSERVESICNDSGTSDYLVVYLRLLISAHLQKNAEFFSFFIEGGRSEVEPMYRECDHLHIVALTAALDICVSVIYLDRGKAESLAIHNFPEDKDPLFFMLYRPNHYDLLYKT